MNSHPNKLPTPFFVSFKHKDKMMLIIANTRMIQFVVVLFTLDSFHSKSCGCTCQAPCLRQTSTQTDSGPERMVAPSRRALPPLPLHCAQRSRLQAFCVYFMHETTQNKQGKDRVLENKRSELCRDVVERGGELLVAEGVLWVCGDAPARPHTLPHDAELLCRLSPCDHAHVPRVCPAFHKHHCATNIHIDFVLTLALTLTVFFKSGRGAGALGGRDRVRVGGWFALDGNMGRRR